MKKFKLVDSTKEESDAVGKDFSDLINKHPNLNITLAINKKIIGIKMANGNTEPVFVDSPTILVQKKVEVVETEVVEEGAIPSTNPEVNPTIKNEPTQEA